MQLKSAMNELSEMGIGLFASHVKAKMTGNYQDYYLNMQKTCESMTLPEIEKHIKEMFKIYIGRDLSLENPQSFDEKIQWLKLYDATPLKTKLVDKYLVRDFVEERTGRKDILVPLLGVWDSFNDINFSNLPNQFVLKTNHGSGMNLVISDKSRFDKAAAKKQFDFWMQMNFAFYNGNFEMQYRDVPRKIIAEKYIEQMDGNLYDYKIHCFDGKPVFLQLIGDRDLKKHTAYESFFDLNWHQLPFSEGVYPPYDSDHKPQCPSNWQEMLDIAQILGEGFSYVRVDLYSINGKTLFGEMTFTPANGIHPGFNPPETDYEWGRLIKLPKKYHLKYPTK